MTPLVPALHPALVALDRALADPRPDRASAFTVQPPTRLDDACRLLHAPIGDLACALQTLTQTDLSGGDLQPAATSLYRAVANALGSYHALARAAAGTPADGPWARLLDSARDCLVTLTQATGNVMAHALHGRGRIDLDIRLQLPGDEAELAGWQPQRLAYARHIVQAALRDAERAEAEAPAVVRALEAGRVASARADRELVKSVFWTQVAAAGLAVWLLGG
jgi:hypothetical protein